MQLTYNKITRLAVLSALATLAAPAITNAGGITYKDGETSGVR